MRTAALCFCLLALAACSGSSGDHDGVVWWFGYYSSGSGDTGPGLGGATIVYHGHTKAQWALVPLAVEPLAGEIPPPDPAALADAAARLSPAAALLDAAATPAGPAALVRDPEGAPFLLLPGADPLPVPAEAARVLLAAPEPLRLLLPLPDGAALPVLLTSR